MEKTPVSAALAEHRGKQYPIVLSNTDWVALGIDRDDEIPDAYAFGDYPSGFRHRQKWAKVPRMSLDGMIHRRVRGMIRGHRLTMQKTRTPELVTLSHLVSAPIDDIIASYEDPEGRPLFAV